MKKIIVIAYYRRSGEFYKRHIQEIFGLLVTVECYCIGEDPEQMDLDADLIVVTSDIIFDQIKNLNTKNAETIIIKRTFTKRGFELIQDLHYDGKILFVSTFYEMAVESIAQLYELGIRHLTLVPYNPLFQREQDADIKMAVTAGEADLVPPYIERIIDIQDRVLDISNIADIGAKLSIPSRRMNNLIESYKNDLIVTNDGFSRMMDEAGELKKQMNTVLSFITDSVIAVDNDGVITEYNEVSDSIFGMKQEQVTGMNIRDFFGGLHPKDPHRTKELDMIALLLQDMETAVENVVACIGGNDVVISKYPLRQDGKPLGIIFISKKYIEFENEHNQIRSKLIPRGHVARYTFDSVLGHSQKVKKLKLIAEKMARSSSTILITGESGTGKEVFAQAIHNASRRKGKPFLAINCSALTANLLESELFGYEEGAFTGAKKGGKVGLFELANGGTIFLDEIGELPYEMQAKLLRVLMERDIMRVGGISVIHVDVRIISATNKNLRELIGKGQFREDLYYRLNVLPLSLPPLRERREDILILAQRFFCEFGQDKALSEEAKKLLYGYDWPGNIRELRNCMEYMYQMSEKEAGAEDMPEYMVGEIARGQVKGPAQGNTEGRPQNARQSQEWEKAVLHALYRMNAEGRSAGRKSISQELAKWGHAVGEQEVRFLLKRLEERQLVQVNRGKKGCIITPQGIEAVKGSPAQG